MALTAQDKFYLNENIIRPESMPILDMVQMVGKKHADYFLNNLIKETDEGTLAQYYKDKVVALCNRVLDTDGSAIIKLKETLINIVWGNTKTIAEIKAWFSDDYELEIGNVIMELFEKVSRVTPAEKTAYNAL